MSLGNRKATLGDRVYAKRKEMKLSQGELASRAGLKDRSSISKIEKGRPASQNTIASLAMALDVSIPYLMGYEDAPEEQAEFEASILMDDDTMELVHIYRGLDDELKAEVKRQAKFLLKRSLLGK